MFALMMSHFFEKVTIDWKNCSVYKIKRVQNYKVMHKCVTTWNFKFTDGLGHLSIYLQYYIIVIAKARLNQF